MSRMAVPHPKGGSQQLYYQLLKNKQTLGSSNLAVMSNGGPYKDIVRQKGRAVLGGTYFLNVQEAGLIKLVVLQQSYEVGADC